jgi:hypothetical protein
MIRIARTLVVSLALAAGSAALPASAAASDTYVCQFTGLGVSFTPPLQPILLDAGGTATIETGWLSGEGSATCFKEDTDPGQSTFSGIYGVTMRVAGDYASQVCGTMDVVASDFSIDAWLPEFQDVGGTLFIDFTAGQGLASLSGLASPQHSGGRGEGVIEFTPTAPGNCIDRWVDRAVLGGSFTARLSSPAVAFR